MSQPGVKQCEVDQPGELDPELNEFWVGNPFQIFQKHNLSCFERNRVYLNVQGEGFLEISHASNADNEGDSRAILALDLFEPGQLDLVLRQVGGGPVVIYRNQFPKANYLKVSLDGVQSNSLGLGSRLIARVADRQIVRELYPINSYQSQQPSWVHFGLSEAEKVDELEIRWPSGKVQKIANVAANRHIRVVEGNDTIEDFARSQPVRGAEQ